MPSAASARPFRKSCTLWVHDQTFSEECVLFNSDLLPEDSVRDGRILKVLPNWESSGESAHGSCTNAVKSHGGNHASSRKAYKRRKEKPVANDQPYVFVVCDINQEEQTKHRNLQISVSKDVASLHGFHSRMTVWVEDADGDQHVASHVELNFSDPLNRADLWKTTISELSRRRCVYQGQELLFLGSIKVVVKKLFVSGQRVPSALFSKSSKPIFRSTSARFIFGIQVSQEMFRFDDSLSNNILWNKATDFMACLLERWKIKRTNHMLTILLFTRIQSTSTAARSAKSPIDLYRVITSDVPVLDNARILQDMNKCFRQFTVEIKEACLERHRSGGPSDIQPALAKHGNLLETINVALSACWMDHLDLDFVRTGTSIVMLSPGPGMFEVDEDLLRITGERLLSRAIGVELVCLSAPPLHVIPLFILRKGSGQQGKETENRTQKIHSSLAEDNALRDVGADKRERLSTELKSIFVLPSWIETSFHYASNQSGAISDMKQFSESHQLQEKIKAGLQSPGSLMGAVTLVSKPPSNGAWPKAATKTTTNGYWNSKSTNDELDIADQKAFIDDNQARPLRPGPSTIVPLNRGHKELTPVSSPVLPPRSSIGRPPLQHQSSHTSVTSSAPSPSTPTGAGKSRLGSLLGRAAFGKAGATTGSSIEQASSTKGGQTSTRATIDPRSLHGQFHVSLSRTSSAYTVPSSSSPPSKTDEADAVATPKPSREFSIDTKDDSHTQESKASDSEPTPLNLPRTRSSAKAKSAPFKPKGDSLPWLVIGNPCSEDRNAVDAFGEWNHAFTAENRVHAVKWKALCSPASLPLTTEHFPSESELQSAFAMNPYKISLNMADSEEQDIAMRRGQLAREMVLYRISEGFQIAVGPQADKVIGASSANASDFYADDFMTADGAAVMMLKGDNIQLLCASGDEVSVTRYQRKIDIPDEMIYKAQIKTMMGQVYETRSLSFTTASDRNWSRVDNEIAEAEADSYERKMAMPTTTSHPRRARFVLIPIEPPNSAKLTHPTSEETDEEVRLDGLRKLTMVWQKNRWIAPEEEKFHASWIGHKDINPLAIEYQTRDPSAVVAAGFESSILTEGESTAVVTQLFDEDESYRTSHVDLQKLAADLQGEHGIPVRSRRWRFRVYDYCFVGIDLTSFILGRFQDIRTREEAVEFGNLLMERGLFLHVNRKHQFRDGNYFYTISSEYRASLSESKSNWFNMRKALTSVPSTPFTEGLRDFSDSNFAYAQGFQWKKPKVCLSGCIQYNVDPRRISTRPEIITIHYDRLHNPDNAFHFMLEWTNATARLVVDSLIFWSSTVARFGLKLVQLPIAEAAMLSEINPLRSPYPIEMTLKAPSIPPKSLTESPMLKPQHTSGAKHYQKELMRKFDFILDHEAMSSFPADVEVGYSWGQLEYRHDQYVHRSGTVLAQIVGDWKFILLANRLHNTNRPNFSREGIYTKERETDSLRYKSSIIPRQTSGAALSTVTTTTMSPVMSPLLRHQSRSDHVSEPSKPTDPSKSRTYASECIKDEMEAFCNDANALRAFYDDVNQQIAENPTPALSALSIAATPSLHASIPNLELPRDDEDDVGLTAL